MQALLLVGLLGVSAQGQGELPAPPDPLPPTAPRTGAPRPHIVLFVVDDLGFNSIGAHNPIQGATHTVSA